jgi:hypothetical protein
MGRFVAAIVAAVAFAAAPAAQAADIGANDDTLKFAGERGPALYRQMADVGLRQTIMTVRWRPSQPDVIQDREFLDTAVPTAVAGGIRVVFAVYPYPPREVLPRTSRRWRGAIRRCGSS